MFILNFNNTERLKKCSVHPFSFTYSYNGGSILVKGISKCWSGTEGPRALRVLCECGFSPAAEASVAAAVSPAEPATAALQTPWHGTGTGVPPVPQSSAPWKLRQTVPREGCRPQASRRRNSLQLNSGHWGDGKISKLQTWKFRREQRLPVNMLASSRSTRVPSLVEIQVKCKGSTSSSPVNAVKLPSAAAQLLTFPFPAGRKTPKTQETSSLRKIKAFFVAVVVIVAANCKRYRMSTTLIRPL